MPIAGPSAATLNARAIELRALAAHTQRTAEQLRAQRRGLADAGATGASISTGLEKFDRIHATWPGVSAQMLAAADILARAAGLRQELQDWFFEKASSIPDDDPLLDVLRRTADELGTGIDIYCAHAVADICTPPPTPPEDLSWLSGVQGAQVLRADEGGLIVAFGDVDEAENITTFVAGTGSSNQAGWPRQVDLVQRLSGHTRGATVLWLGYQAPPTVFGATAHEPARKGGVALREFQKELSRQNPGAKKTVIGYSYGTTVVGEAAREPLEADNVILAGSPGVPEKHASDFRLRPGGNVYAVISTEDPIDATAGPRVGIHGPDPTSPEFGAKVLKVEKGDHHVYWEDEKVLDWVGKIAGG